MLFLFPVSSSSRAPPDEYIPAQEAKRAAKLLKNTKMTKVPPKDIPIPKTRDEL